MDVLSVRLISDRQDLLDDMKARRAGLDAYMIDRLDMYWVYLTTSKGEVCFAVEPQPNGEFYLSSQYNEIDVSKTV